jgi:hypothetical protein
MDSSTQTTISWLDELITLELQDEEQSADHTTSTPLDGDKEDHAIDYVNVSDDVGLSCINDGSPSSSSNSDMSGCDVMADDSPINLPWPKVLQYMRESQGAAASTSHLPPINNKLNIPTDAGSCCYCGNPLEPFDLNASSTEPPSFCCGEFKQHCLLVAHYNKKMEDHRRLTRPGKIKLPYNMKDLKNTQDIALERIRRRQKWEEKKLREKLQLLQNSSIASMARQTKVIQFSLSSPTSMNKDWIDSNAMGKSAAVIKRRRKLQLPLPPINIDVIEGPVNKHLIHRVHYPAPSGGLMSLKLPDNTSICWYPSGNIAIVQILIQPSIHLYLLYEDRKRGALMGYVDGIGRGWIMGGIHSLKFVSGTSKGYIFDGRGRCKEWNWKDVSSYNSMLPLTLRLGRCLTIQYNNQDSISICLSAQQKSVKYSIKKHPIERMYKIDESYQRELQKIKHRFNLHLKSLQETINKLPYYGNNRQRHSYPSYIQKNNTSMKQHHHVTFR